MSGENDRLKILLEQSQRDFIPPVIIQIDTAQIQNIIHGLCKEMISLKKEVTQLKGQLESKTDHADFSVFSNQINNNINELMIQHNDDVKQINSNVEDLKNALIAGLDKCLADAGSVAREMVSEIKPTSPREIARSVTPTQNYQPPIPPAEIVKLTQQIQDLSQRVTQIEEKSNNQDISNLQQQINDQVQQLTNKDIVVDQQFSSEPSSHPPSPHKQREQVDQDSSSLPPSTVTSQKNSPSRSSVHTPNPEISNQLDDINNAVAQLKERLSMLEGSEQLRNMENRESFENVSKLLQEQNDQMKKLSEEISTLQSASEATTRSVKTLEPIKSDISEEVIAQLKSKIQDLESNLFNCVTVTDLNNQMANQKSDFIQFKEMLDECKKQIEETAKQAQLALEQTSQDAALQQTDEFKDLYDLPSKRSSNIPNEEQNKTENNDNSDQKAIDSKEERETTPPATKPSMGAINTDELLDSFLDASQVEFEKMRKGLMDEISQNIRNISTQLQSSIAKESTKFDLGLKKVTAQVTEQGNQFQSDFKTHNYEQMNAIKDLHVTDSELTERIRTLEERIEVLTKLATAPPPKIETLIDEKGKLDLTPILMQMQAQTAMCNDLSSRIVVLENKEEVSPQSFNSLVETISGHEQKLSSLEITATQTDLKISELKEMQNEFQKKLDNPEEDPRITEIREIVMSVEDESKRLRDAMVKFNKDLISCRAAINTLRAHSEETAGIIDDIRKVSEQAKEESTATDKRLKKVIVFIQNENSNFGNQLKDVAQSVERNANRIEEISGRCAEIEALATAKGDHKTKDNKDDDDEFNYYSESSETEKSKPTTAKSSHSAKVDIMTSPHVILPAEDEQTKKEELLIPKIQQPQQQQPMMSASQVVQLPPQVVYEQPIVTVVRKQLENEQFRNTTKSSLPRLGKGPTLTTKQGDVTRTELRKYDELFGKIDQLDQKYSAMKSVIDGLTKQTKQLHESKAEKDALQALFDQFRLAMGELNNRIGTLRKNIIQKADIAELHQLRAEVVKEIKIQGETAAGTEPVRCLLCGNPRHGISGAADGNPAIQPQQMQQTNNRPSAPVAPGMSTRVSGADGNACYVYGENGQLFLGRSGDGKPIILKNLMNDPGNQGMAPGDNSAMLEAT